LVLTSVTMAGLLMGVRGLAYQGLA
jgi:hypothetical protein